ncbi:MAG: AMP-binding protein [Pseudomonadota bacterium]
MSFTNLKITNAVDMLLRDQGDPDRPVLADLSGQGFDVVDLKTLDEQSARLAGWLRSQGLGSGDPILIMQPMSVRLYVALIAVLRLGAMAVFIDPGNMRANLRAACRDLKPLGIIGPSRLLAVGRGDPEMRSVRVRLRTSGWGLRSTPWPRATAHKAAETMALALTEPAIVTFSSGPSGYPLGVVRTHGQILEQHAAMSAVLAPLGTSITATNVPAVALSNLALGVPTVLVRQADKKHVEQLLQNTIKPTAQGGSAKANHVSRLVLSPMVASQLVDSLGPEPLDMDDVVVTGPLYPDVAHKLDQALDHGALRIAYGHPEVDPITEHAFADMISADRLATSVGRGVLVGRPVPEVEIAVLPDDYGMPIGPFSSAEFAGYKLEAGEVGEVVVTGDHMVSHYVNGRSEAETKFSVDGRVWHRTGDAGTLDAQGRLWLMGRCLARMEDELGTTYPLAVEAAARCQLGLRRLACVDHEGRSLLVVESAANLDVEMLQEVIGMTGISGIVVVDRLPMDRYQEAKVDYHRLMQMLTTRRDLVRMDFDDAGSSA